MGRVQEVQRQTGINPLLPFHVLWCWGCVSALFNLQRCRRSAGVYLHSSGMEGPCWHWEFTVLGLCICVVTVPTLEKPSDYETGEEETGLEVPQTHRKCRSVGLRFTLQAAQLPNMSSWHQPPQHWECSSTCQSFLLKSFLFTDFFFC